MAGMANILAGARGYSNSTDRDVLALLAIGQMFSGLGRASSAISDWLRDQELMQFRRAEEERKRKRWEWEQEDRPLTKEAQRSLVEARKRALEESKTRFPLELKLLEQRVQSGDMSLDEAKRQRRLLELKQKALQKIATDNWREKLEQEISKAKTPEEAQALTEAAREWRTALGETYPHYTAADLLTEINAEAEAGRYKGSPAAAQNAVANSLLKLKTQFKNTPEFRKISKIKDPEERLAALKAFYDALDENVKEALTFSALENFYFNRRKLRKDGKLVSVLQTPEFEDPKLIAQEVIKYSQEDPITAMGLLRFYKPGPEGLSIDTDQVKQYIRAPLIKKIAEVAAAQPGATPEDVSRQLLEFAYQMNLQPETNRLYRQGGQTYLLPGEPDKLKIYPRQEGGIYVSPGVGKYVPSPITREDWTAMGLQQNILGKEYQLPKPPQLATQAPMGGGMYFEPGLPQPLPPQQAQPLLEEYKARATGGKTQEDRIKAVTKLLDKLIKLSGQ